MTWMAYEIWADGKLVRWSPTQLEAWLSCRALSKMHKRVWMKKVRA